MHYHSFTKSKSESLDNVSRETRTDIGYHGNDYAVAPVRSKDPSMRGKLCPELAENGMCQNMLSTCDYAHTIEEARSYNQYFKTKVCGFAAKGFCKKGNKCRYAHSFGELDTAAIPDDYSTGATSPTSELSGQLPFTPNISSASTIEPETPQSMSSQERVYGTWPLSI